GLDTPLRPVDSIVSGLRELSPRVRERSIAIGTTPNTPAHLLGRALLSAQEVGLEPSVLIGQGPDGGIVYATVHVEKHLTTENFFHLRIRLGGYLIDSHSGNMEIPRLRREKGFALDLQRLVEKLRTLSVRTADVSFMSN